MAEGLPNEIIVRRFLEEVWNERKFDLIEELIDPNCLTNQLRSGAETGIPRGPDAIKPHIQQWLGGFPDLKFTIEQIFSDQDKVFSQSIMEGTHIGPWME